MAPLTPWAWWTLWAVSALGVTTAVVISLTQGTGGDLWVDGLVLLGLVAALLWRLRDRREEEGILMTLRSEDRVDRAE